MRYLTYLNYTNTDGAMPLLYSVRDAVPYAFSALLLIIFFVLTFIEYFIIKNRTGRGKILTCLLTSSIVGIVLSLLLWLSGLVTYITVLFYAFCAILFFGLFRTSSEF